MSVSFYCVNQLVTDEIEDMEESEFTPKPMRTASELSQILHETYTMRSLIREPLQSNAHQIITEQFLNGVYVYHFSNTFEEKIQISNKWVLDKNKRIMKTYQSKLMQFRTDFEEKMNHVLSKKLKKIYSIQKMQRRIVRKKYYKLKYELYPRIISELLSHV